MEEILKIAGIGVIAAICCVVVRKSAQEIAVALALAAGLLLFGLSIGALERVLDLMHLFAETADLSPGLVAPVIKTVGIAVLTRISAEVCRDAKEGGIASFVETAGTAAALAVGVPLLQAALQTVTGLL